MPAADLVFQAVISAGREGREDLADQEDQVGSVARCLVFRALAAVRPLREARPGSVDHRWVAAVR
jgi:hypothetical protein